MAGLCGWLARSREESSVPAAERLKRMALGLEEPCGEAHWSRVDGRAAVHLVASAGEGDIAAEGSVRAAVHGRFYWREARLAEYAATAGHGRALIEAYRVYDVRLFEHLRGQFSFVLLDLDAGRALLAIDRFGVHSLCYGLDPTNGGRLVFASTAEGVARHGESRPSISPQGLYEYFLLDHVPAPDTIYEGFQKLLPAQYMLYDAGTVRTAFYWCMPYGVDPRDGDAAARIINALKQSVARNMAGLGETGTFLSGGLDSSTITGLACTISGRRVKAFSIGFTSEDFDETYFARLVARHFAVEHHERQVTAADAARFVPRLGALYDEPFVNLSSIPVYYCADCAAQAGVKVLLAGDGGDELFGGNKHYAVQQKLETYHRLSSVLRRRSLKPLLARLPRHGSVPLLARLDRFINRVLAPLPDRLLVFNDYAASDFLSELDPLLRSVIEAERPLAIMRDVYERAAGGSSVHRMLALDLQMILADGDLRKVSRMCHAAGVRVRYPFLDEDVAELAARLPAGALVRTGRLRPFYKKAMRGFLPPETLAKPKHGFGPPYLTWLREDRTLRRLADDALASFRGRGYIRSASVERLRARTGEAAEADAAADDLVWKLLMLELWLEAHEHP
jgi:asparagine synthase (glutamine-hydrolysing)